MNEPRRVCVVVDALRLRPGDLILIGPDRVERVRAASTRDGYGGVIIRTDDHDIVTTLPCSVKIVGVSR